MFLFVPSHRIKFYDWQLAEKISGSFPAAANELARAGKCYSKGEPTACVFHSMRAAEMGLRAFAQYLKITFPYSIDVADWKNIIDKIETEIKSKQQLPKGMDKSEELKFCSDAGAQFRYFKDAYRIFVAHARASYDEEQALSIMQRTGEFIVGLSTKLAESTSCP
jgi:hypothetical protein